MSSHSANDKSSVPQLSVCVVTYGRRNQDVDRALHSVFEYTSDMTVEVILVDNGSSDNTLEMIAEKFPSVIVIHNQENIGYAPAMNLALEKSKGKYILCLSVDAEILPGSVQTLINFMEDHPKCGLSGPRALDGLGEILTTMHHANLFFTIWSEIIPVRMWLRRNRVLRKIATFLFPNYSGLTSNYMKTQKVRLLDGGILLSRRSFLEDVGLLDQNLPLGPDDYDWCSRAIKKGYEIWYVAESTMIHCQRPREDPIKLSPLHLFSYLPPRLYFYGKNHKGPKFLFFQLSTLILSFKWKWKILCRYGKHSIQYKAVKAAHEICLRPERYIDEVANGWPQKFFQFNSENLI